MSTDTYLNPCPFCGGRAKFVWSKQCAGHGSSANNVRVACGCGVSTVSSMEWANSHQKEEANVAAIWNRRDDNPPEQPMAKWRQEL